MKDKQLACVVVVMAIAACFFGIMKMQAKLQDARKKAEGARTTAENTQRQRINAANAYKSLQEKSRDKISYYEIWKPAFESYPNTNAVTTQIQKLMTDSRVDPFNEGFNPQGYKDKHGIIKQIQRASLIFQGDYATLFNWLGQVEQLMPTSRISSCRVRKATGDAEIRMEVTIDVPTMPNEDEKDSNT